MSKRAIEHLKKAKAEIDRALAFLEPYRGNLTDGQVEYLEKFEIALNTPYILEGQVVRPFAVNGDEKNTGAALDRGFIHFRYEDGTTKYCGVGYFQDNAIRTK